MNIVKACGPSEETMVVHIEDLPEALLSAQPSTSYRNTDRITRTVQKTLYDTQVILSVLHDSTALALEKKASERNPPIPTEIVYFEEWYPQKNLACFFERISHLSRIYLVGLGERGFPYLTNEQFDQQIFADEIAQALEQIPALHQPHPSVPERNLKISIVASYSAARLPAHASFAERLCRLIGSKGIPVEVRGFTTALQKTPDDLSTPFHKLAEGHTHSKQCDTKFAYFPTQEGDPLIRKLYDVSNFFTQTY